MNKKIQISAEVVAHSINPQGDELFSVLATFPRIIIAEMNTHRMLSKNTSSSRAIPFNKMMEAIQTNPFIPIAWQKHHSGMQGNEYWDVTIKGEIGELDHTNIPAKWLRARDTAVTMAEVLHDGPQGVTKQICNRLLEPFMWTTMLITGSREGWDNFFRLRCPSYRVGGKGDVVSSTSTYRSKKDAIKDYPGSSDEPEINWMLWNEGQAEIHMMALAESIWDSVNESTPKQLAPGQWHIPFYDKITDLLIDELAENEAAFITDEKVAKISVAMAAHTSYTVVAGQAVKSPEKWLELHDKLLNYDPPHSSPMEHCARAMSEDEYGSFYKGSGYDSPFGKGNGWCYNLKGFIPYRYFVDNGLVI